MTQDAIADYATWTEPDTSFQVHYSLPVFHEIDLAVSEGYRRIPHGGIEVGGLLFGRRFQDGVRIEAFRPIECEHALGPSFKLSERDISGLREQIERVDGDPELGGLETLGWFIAHTRGPLQSTETEAQLFNDILPGSGMLTVLVKPEKFKPTLFAFLVRRRDGTTEVDGEARAIILPLPGQQGRLPAEQALPLTPVVPIPASPEPRETAATRAKIREALSEMGPVDPPPVQPPVQPSRTQVIEPELREPAISPPSVEPSPAVTPAPPAGPPLNELPELPAPPASSDRQSPMDQPLFAESMQSGVRGSTRDERRPATFVGLIALAAILALGAIYWVFQGTPNAVIQLTVEPQPNGVIVSWPPVETSGASHAFVRVNDGPLTELPPDAKSAGRWEVQAQPDNVKVEIVAQHILRNSRGIVRYIQPGP